MGLSPENLYRLYPCAAGFSSRWISGIPSMTLQKTQQER
jgi:hypothetical protein